MAITRFRQGDDVKLPVRIVADPALDFSLATDIRVILLSNDIVQYRYSLDEMTDHGSLEVDSVSDDTINVFVERDQSIEFSTGTIKAEVIAVFPDAEFPDGGKTTTWNIMVAKVTAGKALDEIV